VNSDADGASTIDPSRYCREIEAHLCRKNDGHLIRIVGPAFELVSGWAQQGVPLRVAFEGIDRVFERYYSKGPRRRPVHISFCEGDVLDAFDAWRRATGVPQPSRLVSDPDRRRTGGHTSLATHIDRAIASLTARRAGANGELDAALEAAVRSLDRLRAAGKTIRGEARARALERLRALDVELLTGARASLSPAADAALVREAEESLGPFRQRMTEEAWTTARDAAIDRAIRAALGLPVLTFE
jgi:hypothetical protein